MIRFQKRSNFRVNQDIYEKLKSGIFCVNKEINFTSAQTLEIIKNAISLAQGTLSYKLKIGHGGTLDSSANGVLVVGTGIGCKNLTKFLCGSKRYYVRGKFGEATNTYNDLGRVTHQEKFSHITSDSIISCISRFKGKILQTPPPYCALKRGGKRISDLVSAGEEVVLAPREVECHSIELLDFKPPYFTLNVDCGGGFYIRSLVNDLGIALGSCAHVKDLCRTQQGPFAVQDCLLCDNLSLENIVYAIQTTKIKYANELECVNDVK